MRHHTPSACLALFVRTGACCVHPSVHIAIIMFNIKDALGYIKGLADIAKTVQANDIKIQMQDLVLKLQSELMTLSQDYAAALERNREVEQQMRDLQSWEEEKKRYALTQIREGLLVYRLKPEFAGKEPGHDLCPHCFERGAKSMLLRVSDYAMDTCNTCGFECDLPGSPPDGGARGNAPQWGGYQSGGRR